MRYGGFSKSGVQLNRDCYAEHFAEPGDLKFNYSVSIHGDCIAENEDRKALAKELKLIAERLMKIAVHLKTRKAP